MEPPYQSTTEVPDFTSYPSSSRATVGWLAAFTILGCVVSLVLFVILFNLAMGPYYGPPSEAPLWFQVASNLIWILPVAVELCGIAYFVLRWKFPSPFSNEALQLAIDLLCGLVVMLVAVPLVLIAVVQVKLLIYSLSAPSGGPTITVQPSSAAMAPLNAPAKSKLPPTETTNQGFSHGVARLAGISGD